MDESNVGAKPDPQDLEPRPPAEADLAALCRELNQRGARYVVIGGFAIIAAGLPRVTGDIDLMVAVDPENEARVFSALSTLPDNAVRELQPGELQQHNVIRVADEILVDLMRSAGASNTRRLPRMWSCVRFRVCPSVCLPSSALADEDRDAS